MVAAERAISVAADATLALVVILAALGVLVAFTDLPEDEHEPATADYTAQTLAGSTANVTYDVSEAVEALDREAFALYEEYPLEGTERVAHGPFPAQIAAVAVANAEIDGERLTVEANDYERALDDRLQRALVHAQFETQVTAVWKPVDGVDLQGETVMGQSPPVDADVSTATMTVSSGAPAVAAEPEALDDDEFDVLARAVADAIVEGYLPEHESQRALESSGLAYYLTTYRYVRMASVLPAADSDSGEFERWLVPFDEPVDAEAANAYLSEHLAAELETALAERYESATEAAANVSAETVTITVRTWQ